MKRQSILYTSLVLFLSAGLAGAQPPGYEVRGETGISRIQGSGDLKEAKIAVAWGDRLKPPTQYPQSIINLREAMMKWTNIPTEIKSQVRLSSPDIHKLPILIISAGDQFDLTEIEKSNLREYIRNGGFVVADGSMRDASGASLLQMVRDIAGNKQLESIPLDHPIYRTPFLVGGPRGGENAPIMPSNTPGRIAQTDEVVGLSGVFINGRLAMLYSPKGYYGSWNSVVNDASLKFGVNLIMYAIGGS
jgi:hypothetical protein